MNNLIKIISIVGLLVLIGCKADKKDVSTDKEVEKETQAIEAKKTETIKGKEKSHSEILELEASRLRAGGSVKSAVLIGDKAVIKYVKDFKEYKSINPNSRVTEEDLANYWSTGKAIKKALVDGSVKLMKKMEFINETEIELPIKGKVYSISVSKDKLEKFTGQPFKTMCEDFGKSFSDKYVYNESGRDKFFKTFGQIK
jgi:hypothetical protein